MQQSRTTVFNKRSEQLRNLWQKYQGHLAKIWYEYIISNEITDDAIRQFASLVQRRTGGWPQFAQECMVQYALLLKAQYEKSLNQDDLK